VDSLNGTMKGMCLEVNDYTRGTLLKRVKAAGTAACKKREGQTVFHVHPFFFAKFHSSFT